jgi:hypothetical protein
VLDRGTYLQFVRSVASPGSSAQPCPIRRSGRGVPEDPDGEEYPFLARCRAHVLGDHLGRAEPAIRLAAIAIEREPSFYYLRIMKAELESKLGLNEDAERSLGDLQTFFDDDMALMKAIQIKLRFASSCPTRSREAGELTEKLIALADKILASASRESQGN